MHFHLPTAPGSPAQNSTVERTTSTTISLSWEPPVDDQRNGIITLYIIRVVSVDAGTTAYYNSSVLSATVTPLKPSTTYECSIAAETSAGRGPFSSPMTVQTDEAGIRYTNEGVAYIHFHIYIPTYQTEHSIVVVQCTHAPTIELRGDLTWDPCPHVQS